MSTITTNIERPWESSPFKEVFTYWDSLRGGKILPSRVDFRPEKLGAVLREIAIIEKIDGEFYFRHYSSGLRERLQADATGKNIMSFALPRAIEHGRLSLDTAMTTPAAAFGQIRNYFTDKVDGTPSSSVYVDGFYLPMTSKDGEQNLLLTLYHLATPEHQQLAEAKAYGASEMLNTRFYDIGAGTPAPLTAPGQNAES